MEILERKPIHGLKPPHWERLGLQEHPPIECDFKIGDRVIFTNEYGLKFDDEVIGFSKDAEFYGKFIHLMRYGGTPEGGAWWFPHSPMELKKWSI